MVNQWYHFTIVKIFYFLIFVVKQNLAFFGSAFCIAASSVLASLFQYLLTFVKVFTNREKSLGSDFVDSY